MLRMSRVTRLSIPTLASMALILGATTAGAQMGGMPSSYHERMIHVGIGGGASIPTADAKDVLKNGYTAHAWVSLTPPILPVTLRAALDYQKSDFSKVTTTTFTGIPGPTGNNQVIAGLANMRINLMRGVIEPYVTAGLGGYSVKTDLSGTGTPNESKVHFGINGGAGLAVRISQIHVYVEGRVDNVYTDKGAIDAKTIQLVPVTLGISY
jgi:outer membrane protein with beta-barrel domain